MHRVPRRGTVSRGCCPCPSVVGCSRARWGVELFLASADIYCISVHCQSGWQPGCARVCGGLSQSTSLTRFLGNRSLGLQDEMSAAASSNGTRKSPPPPGGHASPSGGNGWGGAAGGPLVHPTPSGVPRAHGVPHSLPRAGAVTCVTARGLEAQRGRATASGHTANRGADLAWAPAALPARPGPWGAATGKARCHPEGTRAQA